MTGQRIALRARLLVLLKKGFEVVAGLLERSGFFVTAMAAFFHSEPLPLSRSAEVSFI